MSLFKTLFLIDHAENLIERHCEYNISWPQNYRPVAASVAPEIHSNANCLAYYRSSKSYYAKFNNVGETFSKIGKIANNATPKANNTYQPTEKLKINGFIFCPSGFFKN